MNDTIAAADVLSNGWIHDCDLNEWVDTYTYIIEEIINKSDVLPGIRPEPINIYNRHENKKYYASIKSKISGMQHQFQYIIVYIVMITHLQTLLSYNC